MIGAFDNRKRLNGVFAEKGTIVGPTPTTREFMVADATDERGTLFRYATQEDMADAQRRLRNGQPPRSVAEQAIAEALKRLEFLDAQH